MRHETSCKRLCLIGSTGSIGTQTLDIVAAHPDRYAVTVLCAGSNVNALTGQALRFRPRSVVIADDGKFNELKKNLEGTGIKVHAGAQALCEAVQRADVDMIVNATVGYSGLAPTIAAIGAGKDIALANKETLVVAGELIRRLLKSSPSRIYPIDSEHSAIAQCLAGEDTDSVRRLIITASGGPFRTWTTQQLEKATVADALHHPNWSMGAKITIDSATMLNKAFEIIEAHYLFNIPAERIVPMVHPQSIVHSMVEFADGAVKAQLGIPDMRLPIAYALGEGKRLAGASNPLTLPQMMQLTFSAPDTGKFPCLTFAETALKRGGNAACTINAANEVANLAFRQGKIPFNAIYTVVARTLDHEDFIEAPEYEDYVATNTSACRHAAEIVHDIAVKTIYAT
ncbi:MAG: 1-deoxy-D-xylulose-5-phosphate reductoisomerase [Bacteroidales bacterium]|nr:1-deoxy-D-xylulose-5-phosphate reductoisomerase [Bacteroidales bacterium]